MKFKLALLIFLSITLSACFPTYNSGSIKTGVQGQFSKGKAPKGFPSIPLYPKAKLLESYGSAQQEYGATAISSDDVSKVVEFYNSNIGKFGWEFTLSQLGNQGPYTFNIKNSKLAGSVIINTSADNKRTAITIAVAPR